MAERIVINAGTIISKHLKRIENTAGYTIFRSVRLCFFVAPGFTRSPNVHQIGFSAFFLSCFRHKENAANP